MPAPAERDDREQVLDVVRGVALLGVLTVNTLTIFRVSLFEALLSPELRPVTGTPSAIEDAIDRGVTIGLEMKAFILFSLLFGVGLAAQSERVRGISFARFTARRLGALLVIGLVHLVLVWNGDILTLYALLGLLAAPLIARASSRTLLALALLLFGLHVAPLPYPPAFPDIPALVEHVEAARHIYPYGSFRHVLAFRIVELRPIAALLVRAAPRTLGLLFLGALVWRTRIFRDASRLVPVAASSLVLGAIASALDSEDAAAVLLALGYGSAVAAGYHRAPRVLAIFAPIGRMALTSYLAQSIVLGAIFYGYGLGQFAMLPRVAALAIVGALFVAQMIFARLWLARFRYGPLEWVWRSFTYGARQPFVAS